MKINKHKALLFALVLTLNLPCLHASERPTLNPQTNDPRPDILAHPFYDSRPEYRREYNRPRYWSGKLAYHMSRTSQEAMAWQENYCAGNYACPDMAPLCKHFYYPKPWEGLNTGARPDTQVMTKAPATPSVVPESAPPAPKLTKPKDAAEKSNGLSDKESTRSDKSPSDSKPNNSKPSTVEPPVAPQ